MVDSYNKILFSHKKEEHGNHCYTTEINVTLCVKYNSIKKAMKSCTVRLNLKIIMLSQREMPGKQHKSCIFPFMQDFTKCQLTYSSRKHCSGPGGWGRKEASVVAETLLLTVELVSQDRCISKSSNCIL